MHFTKKNSGDKRKDFVNNLKGKKLLRFPGAYNPLCAKLIAEIGFDGVYVSGASLSADMGLPDIGLTSQTEVVTRSGQIAKATMLPTIVGFQKTQIMILTHTIILISLTLILTIVSSNLGLIYLSGTIILGALYMNLTIRLMKNYSTTQDVKFTLTESSDSMSCNIDNLKLSSYLYTSNMVLFDENNQLKKYSTVFFIPFSK